MLNKQPNKILILTDSSANPRSFPVSMMVHLEDTFPYLLRSEFKDAIFYQLSFGNLTTERLVGQAISYLSHWRPDFIIVYSGMADCRPESFTEFEKTIINRLSGPFFGRIKKYVFHPKLIERRQIYRVSRKKFRKTITKFKMIFSNSKIFWLEISAGSGYETMRPGVNNRMAEYNKIIEEVYGNDFVRIKEKMLENNGFNADNMHWTKKGHQILADNLIGKIKSCQKEPVECYER